MGGAPKGETKPKNTLMPPNSVEGNHDPAVAHGGWCMGCPTHEGALKPVSPPRVSAS